MDFIFKTWANPELACTEYHRSVEGFSINCAGSPKKKSNFSIFFLIALLKTSYEYPESPIVDFFRPDAHVRLIKGACFLKPPKKIH